MNFPDNCKYTKDHEWIRLESGNVAYIGITDFAQSELGDLVYVETSPVGATVSAHQVFGTIEAVKTTSDLYMPVTATIVEVNGALDGSPDLINTDPYAAGWIIKVEVANLADLDALMDAPAYKSLVA